ncbi:MAG: MFS transporter [Clostridia bacterium]|nr:MFS transporter [Clostridia bacterium]
MITLRYAVIQLFFWMMYGNANGFASVYLLDRGFTNTQIGIMIAIAGVVSAVFQPAIASYADRSDSIPIRYITSGLSAVGLLSYIILLLTGKGGVLTTVFYGVAVFSAQLTLPFVNAMGAYTINGSKGFNFGVARAFGSVGYALLSYSLGAITARLGSGFIIVAGIVVSTLFIISVLSYPNFSAEHSEKANDKGSSIAEFIKKYKSFCIILVGCFLLQIGHVLINTFAFQIVQVKGGDKAEVGVAMALAAILELPMLFVLSKIMKKIKVGTLFRLSGIGLTLKVLFSLLAPNVATFYVVQIFQMFGWAVLTGSSVYYINSIMEPHDAVKGQAYLTMAQTVASVAASLVCGRMIDGFGANTTLFITTIISVIGMLILLLVKDKKEATA